MAAGSISIDVLANTTKLVKGMKRAEGVVAKSARNMTRAMYAFGAIFATGKLTAAIGRSATEIDKLGKTASKLGVGTKELGALQYAAEQSGVGVNTLNMALQRSTRRIAEAARGTGEAVKALEELGLSAKDLNQLSPDEQLNAIADAMGNVTNQSDKVRLSMKLFDSEGVALVNMLSGGSAALKEYYNEASSLGILMEDSMVRKVEAANDAQNRFKKALSVTATTINTQLAPYIIHASNVLVELIKRFTNSSEASTIFSTVIEGVARGFIIGFNAMQLAVDGFMTSWSAVMLALEIGKETFGFDADVTGAIIAFREQADLTKISFDELILSTKGLDQNSLNLVAALKKINAEFVTTGVVAPESLKKVNTGLKDTDKIAKSVSSTISGGITSAFKDGMDGAVNFGDTIKNVLKGVVAQLIEVLVIQKAVNAAMGISGGGSGGATGAVVSGVSGGLATGGTLKSAGTYVVGEQGPEILNLPAGANVTPNGQTQTSAAPVVNVFNNTESQVDVETDEKGQIDIIINKISNDITRGVGPIGSSIENRYGISKR